MAISPNQRAKVREYIQARRKSATANSVIESLKGEVLSIVRLAGGRVLMLNAVCLRGDSVTYDYPASVRRSEEALRTEKKMMQLNGRAQKIVKDCLQFEDLRAE